MLRISGADPSRWSCTVVQLAFLFFDTPTPQIPPEPPSICLHEIIMQINVLRVCMHLQGRATARHQILRNAWFRYYALWVQLTVNSTEDTLD